MTTSQPLRVAVLCSRRAPGLMHLLDCDPDHGRRHEIVCVVASEDDGFEEQTEVGRRGVPVSAHPIRAFYNRVGARLYRDFDVRAAYDAETTRLLNAHGADLVLLAGYVYLVTEPLLAAYAGRLLNLHLSDLTLRLPDGRPRFPGLRAVRDALTAGLPATCATVHAVDAQPDGGAPIVRSWPFPVSPLVGEARAWGAADMLKAYAFAHQQWMIRAASGPLWSAALRLVQGGDVDLEALGSIAPSAVVPWTLDVQGRLVPGQDGVRLRIVGGR